LPRSSFQFGRFELKGEPTAGMDESRHDVVLQRAIDGAAIEFVGFEGRFDLPRTDIFGFALLGAKRHGGQADESGKSGCGENGAKADAAIGRGGRVFGLCSHARTPVGLMEAKRARPEASSAEGGSEVPKPSGTKSNPY